jgi:hypothetical protein
MTETTQPSRAKKRPRGRPKTNKDQVSVKLKRTTVKALARTVTRLRKKNERLTKSDFVESAILERIERLGGSTQL